MLINRSPADQGRLTFKDRATGQVMERGDFLRRGHPDLFVSKQRLGQAESIQMVSTKRETRCLSVGYVLTPPEPRFGCVGQHCYASASCQRDSQQRVETLLLRITTMAPAWQLGGAAAGLFFGGDFFLGVGAGEALAPASGVAP